MLLQLSLAVCWVEINYLIAVGGSEYSWSFYSFANLIYCSVCLFFSIEGEREFFFGLATAPAHVEDRLNDAWLQFAEEHPCNSDTETSELPQGMQPAVALVGSAAGDGGSQQASYFQKETDKGKPLKIAMEAMIRGFKKYVGEEEEVVPSDECHHNVAAWHNVPHP